MLERGTALYEILRHVRPLVLNSARVVEATLRPHRLTIGSRAVLEILAESGPAPVPAIAERLDLARQNVQRHVDDLIELVCAEARPNPAHRRSMLIALTDGGARLFDELRAEELTRLAELAQECTPEEIAIAAKVLAALDRDVRSRVR